MFRHTEHVGHGIKHIADKTHNHTAAGHWHWLAALEPTLWLPDMLQQYYANCQPQPGDMTFIPKAEAASTTVNIAYPCSTILPGDNCNSVEQQ